MAQHQPIRKSPPPGADISADIPDKLYFRIGEVSRLVDVPAYVLRFWESEFPNLKPHKGGTGQRLYRRRDVETALRIKSLLYSEGYTIPGARQAFKIETKHKAPQLALAIEEAPAATDPRRLRKLQKDLRDLLDLLSKPSARAPVQPIRAPRRASEKSEKPERTPTAQRSDRLFDLPPITEDKRH